MILYPSEMHPPLRVGPAAPGEKLESIYGVSDDWQDWPAVVDSGPQRGYYDVVNALLDTELRPTPPSDAVGGESDKSLKQRRSTTMPRLTSSITGAAPAVPMNGTYPKLLKGRAKSRRNGGTGGSVWLVTAPNTGTIVHLATSPQKAKHKLGYYSTRLVENTMDVFEGTVALKIAA